MIDIINQLKQLNLPEREIKVMNYLLHYGDSLSYEISKKVGINRTTTYDILNKLEEKKLISKIIQKGKFKFQITPPKQWVVFLEKQEEEITKQKKYLNEILPELNVVYNKSDKQPKVLFYEGIDGIKQIALDSLEVISPEIVGYSCVSMVTRYLPQKFVKYYTNEKIKREIKSRFVLRNDNDSAEFIEKYKKEYYSKDKNNEFVPKYRLAEKTKHLLDNEIMIYDNKFVIINITPPNFIAILIQNKEIADSQKSIFEITWKNSKPI